MVGRTREGSVRREKHLRHSWVAKPAGIIKEIDIGHEGSKVKEDAETWGLEIRGSWWHSLRLTVWLPGLESGLAMNWFFAQVK